MDTYYIIAGLGNPGIKYDPNTHRVSYDPSAGNIELLAGQKNEIEDFIYNHLIDRISSTSDI